VSLFGASTFTVDFVANASGWLAGVMRASPVVIVPPRVTVFRSVRSVFGDVGKVGALVRAKTSHVPRAAMTPEISGVLRIATASVCTHVPTVRFGRPMLPAVGETPPLKKPTYEVLS
jgi:hypothetical protein